MKAPARPVTLMLAAQIVCVLSIPLTFLVIVLSIRAADVPHALCGVILGLCLVAAEYEAFRLCGRMRHASAFSAANVSGLGRIMAALGIAGCVSLIFGDPLMPFLMAGLADISPIVIRLLLPFTLLTLSLMLRAVQVLMRRAVDMQEESDLTV